MLQRQVGTALQQCYNTSVPKKAETRIIECMRCGIHTRHEREAWIQPPLPPIAFDIEARVTGP